VNTGCSNVIYTASCRFPTKVSLVPNILPIYLARCAFNSRKPQLLWGPAPYIGTYLVVCSNVRSRYLGTMRTQPLLCQLAPLFVGAGPSVPPPIPTKNGSDNLIPGSSLNSLAGSSRKPTHPVTRPLFYFGCPLQTSSHDSLIIILSDCKPVITHFIILSPSPLPIHLTRNLPFAGACGVWRLIVYLRRVQYHL
jgi:hypothetical protein